MPCILLNCYEYPPSIHGGVGTFTRDLAEGLTREGWTVWVIGVYSSSLYPLSHVTNEVKNGVNIVRIPQANTRVSLINMFIDRFRLYFYSKKLHYIHKFDIMESPESTGWYPFGSPIKPFVVRLHGAQVFFDAELSRKGSRLWHFFENLTIRNANFLVAVSKYCGNRTLEIIKYKKKFSTIYNGVDVDKILLMATDKTEPLLTDPYIVFANSVIPKKGIEELLLAFNTIAVEYPTLKLVVVGKALGMKTVGQTYLSYLTTLINPDIQSRVIFTGWLAEHSDVFNYLKHAKICIYPSHMEGQGIAPTEAMLLGRPVIFMENGPGPEVIDDRIDGLLVNTKSIKAIEGAIKELLLNADFCSELGLEAVEKVKTRFNKQTWLKDNISLYSNLINNNKK